MSLVSYDSQYSPPFPLLGAAAFPGTSVSVGPKKVVGFLVRSAFFLLWEQEWRFSSSLHLDQKPLLFFKGQLRILKNVKYESGWWHLFNSIYCCKQLQNKPTVRVLQSGSLNKAWRSMSLWTTKHLNTTKDLIKYNLQLVAFFKLSQE